MRLAMIKLLHVVTIPLPQVVKRLVFRHIFGWSVADDAIVGFSYMGTKHATLEAGSRIGHLNIVRNVTSLHLGRNAFIKDCNHIFGGTPFGMSGAGSFRLGDGARIMSRHFFEVAGAIDIRDRALIGGRGTQIYTHSVVVRDGLDKWKVGEMIIGEDANIYASAILVHCRVPPRAIVTAGAVLTKSFDADGDERLLIGGNPAVVIGKCDPPPPKPVAGAG